MTPVWLEILTACAVASVLEMAIHWAPWPATVKKSLEDMLSMEILIVRAQQEFQKIGEMML